MPSAKDSTSAASNSGIITSSSGEQRIPSSTRADGSVRKEIRVRPGYRPPEDVEVYKNRTAEAWRTRGKGGVPGAEFIQEKNTSNSKKPKKKPKANDEKTEGKANDSVVEGDKEDIEETQKEMKVAEQNTGTEQLHPEAEKEKEAKKLSKKLRQARDLQKKKEEGDSLLPEQLEKIIRMNELIRQLDNLGFDADGQRKT